MIKFTLPLPPVLNSTYKMGKGNFYKVDKAREWEKEALYTLMEQHVKTDKIKEWVYVGLEVFVKRDRDIDSSLKIVLDLLQDRVYLNDSQVQHLNVKKYMDKENPRIEITVAVL